MKKSTIFLVSIMLLLVTMVGVLGFSLHWINQKDDPYLETARILLNSYGLSVDTDGEILSFKAGISEIRTSLETYRNSGAERCNLDGAALDLSGVFTNHSTVRSEYADAAVHVCYFPLVNDQWVATRAKFLFIDDTLVAAYIVISDPLAASYIRDAGITDSPTSFWPLDVSQDVLQEDLDAWAEIFRR